MFTVLRVPGLILRLQGSGEVLMNVLKHEKALPHRKYQSY